MQEIYKDRIKDVNDLCSRIMKAWDEVGQRAFDMAVGKWRFLRLRVCVPEVIPIIL